jgi:RNA polymerase-binding transcription factor DksA
MTKRDDLDYELFKKALEAELELLRGELKGIGRVNPDNPADWEALPEPMDTSTADKNESADSIEEFEVNTAIVKSLETRWNAVKDALAEIEEGTYGFCQIGGEPIEKERLEANPSARTCLNHA